MKNLVVCSNRFCWTLFLITLTGCNINFVECDGPIGTPWTADKLKALEGDWRDASSNEEQNVTKLRVSLNDKGTCLDFHDLSRDQNSQSNEQLQVIVTSLKNVNVCFLTSPKEKEKFVLFGAIEIKDDQSVSIRSANTDAFRQHIENGALTGTIEPPVSKDSQPKNANVKESKPVRIHLRATEAELNQLIDSKGINVLFDELQPFLKRTKK